MVAEAHAVASSWSKGLRPLIIRGAASVGGQVGNRKIPGVPRGSSSLFQCQVGSGGGADLCHVADEGHDSLLVYSAS